MVSVLFALRSSRCLSSILPSLPAFYTTHVSHFTPTSHVYIPPLTPSFTAWVTGAADPVSGTVSMAEVIRAFGAMMEEGWKPVRTILFASWDAEEYSLVGSTEYGEDFAQWIGGEGGRVVAYLNLGASQSAFSAPSAGIGTCADPGPDDRYGGIRLAVERVGLALARAPHPAHRARYPASDAAWEDALGRAGRRGAVQVPRRRGQ